MNAHKAHYYHAHSFRYKMCKILAEKIAYIAYIIWVIVPFLQFYLHFCSNKTFTSQNLHKVFQKTSFNRYKSFTNEK